MTEKRRRKTGCLTCRTRRVKCDERKPDCERCEIANVECAGYAEKRRLKIQYPGQGPTTGMQNDQNGNTSPLLTPPDSTASSIECVKTGIGENGLPLVALPNNPNPAQRPHSRARDMLGYHQYLYRTLPILFPSKSFHYWRDFLCEAAWETEWAFDAIVALGSIHRAVLLSSQESGNCRDRGLDTKITAIQVYVRALEGLSDALARTKNPTPLTVGVMVLMAYIECFSGNIPAAIRHTQVIQYHSYTMRSDDKHPGQDFTSPIESSIRDLELICRIVRPFPSPLEPISLSNAEKSTVNLPSSFFEIATGSNSGILQQLLEFTSADLDLKHLAWCVYAAHYKSVSKEKVLAFLKALEDWRANNSAFFPVPSLEDSSKATSFHNLEKLPFPPPCYENVQRDSCLVLGLYTFYRARLLWALCLLDDPEGTIELDAYLHIYRFMRYAKTALTISGSDLNQSIPDGILPCESLRIGLSPLLYLAGRCCPTPSWLRWIIQELGSMSEEGLYHPKPFATTLDILLLLEQQTTRNLIPSPGEERFVPPRSRTIALFIPDIDGRSFEAYYARPEETDNDKVINFNISRVARWSDTSNGAGPVIQDYEIYQQQFSREWLMQQPLVQKWVNWSFDSEFDLNQVIQDHIVGNRLLLEAERE